MVEVTEFGRIATVGPVNVDHALPYGMKALKGLPGIKRKEPNQHNKKERKRKKCAVITDKK